MMIGYVMVEDADPKNAGFVTRRYTSILIEMTPGTPGWSWIQRDDQRNALASKGGFTTEDEARDAATAHFAGVWVDGVSGTKGTRPSDWKSLNMSETVEDRLGRIERALFASQMPGTKWAS